MPLYIVSVAYIIYDIRGKWSKVLLTLLIISVTGAITLGMSPQTSPGFWRFERTVESYQLLPEIKGYVLTDTDRVTRFAKIDKSKLEIFPGWDEQALEYSIDVYPAIGLERAGLLSHKWKNWRNMSVLPTDYARAPDVVRNMAQGKYDAIVVGAISQNAPLAQLVTAVVDIQSQKAGITSTPSTIGMRCYFTLPTAEHPCPKCSFNAHILLRKLEDCALVYQKIEPYYASHFDEICRYDRKFAEATISILARNNITINKSCEIGGDNLKKLYGLQKASAMIASINTSVF
jgi:hypothetical protein